MRLYAEAYKSSPHEFRFHRIRLYGAYFFPDILELASLQKLAGIFPDLVRLFAVPILVSRFGTGAFLLQHLYLVGREVDQFGNQ